jgi:hypothetical protein
MISEPLENIFESNKAAILGFGSTNPIVDWGAYLLFTMGWLFFLEKKSVTVLLIWLYLFPFWPSFILGLVGWGISINSLDSSANFLRSYFLLKSSWETSSGLNIFLPKRKGSMRSFYYSISYSKIFKGWMSFLILLFSLVSPGIIA